MNMSARHLWQGEWIGDRELEARIAGLGEALNRDFPEKLALGALLEACDRLSGLLRAGAVRERLLACLSESGRFSEIDAQATLEELATFLERSALTEKLSRELASGNLKGADPARLERIDYRRDVFEAWAPIGFLVHIAPTNAINVPFMSVLEGLLAGNVCFLKTGGGDLGFPQLCLRALLDCDGTGTLWRFVYAARISSKRQDLLKQLVAQADGVAVWGGEEAITGIRAIAPAHARVIEWGPKISLAYVAASHLTAPSQELLEKLARDCCLMEQQACSSPQVVYAETDDPETLLRFARQFAGALEKISSEMPAVAPEAAERAEITRVVEVARLEGDLPGSVSQVIEARDGTWRVLVEAKEGLRASPLYRTVWLKPLPRTSILRFLRPLRHYLQTVGLACDRASLGELSSLFFRAGALRVMPVGEMLSGYMGEPHDGVYALQRYSRRVSVTAPQAAGWSAIDFGGTELEREGAQGPEIGAGPGPVMGKEQFGAVAVDEIFSELFFKSGGSSGEPKLSIFTYDDYHAQMRAAAHGVYAAGLDPKTDRCMNLFFCGGLYGGFISFFTILEDLKAVQLPMTAYADLDFVGRMIVEKRVDTLLAMPSYLAGLFRANEERFKKYRGIKKIFFGGEHMRDAQRSHFREEFGVELIRSAAYGSNDIGPMGYQCDHCPGSLHHLHEGLHELEILDLVEDRPATAGEAGRLVFTSRIRKGQKLARYDLGDLGRWIEEPCPCGRLSPRFELLGRQGDIFRCGGTFLNYQKFAVLLAELSGFGAGEFQLEVSCSVGPGLSQEILTLSYAGAPGVAPGRIREACLEEYKDLYEVVVEDAVVALDVRAVEGERLERVVTSGKLRHILDRRQERP